MLRTLLRFTRVQSLQLIRRVAAARRHPCDLNPCFSCFRVALVGFLGFLFVLVLAGSKLLRRVHFIKPGSWKVVTWESSGKGGTLPLGDEVGMLGQRECIGKGPECLFP